MIVHRIVASLSPMKDSTSGSIRYFDGELTDGKTSCRVVGFDKKQQERLEDLREKKEAVALVNCELKSSKWGPQLEVMMNRHTEVQKSPAAFDVANLVTTASSAIGLDQLQGLQNYQQVTIRVKVVSAKEESEVKGGLRMQDYVIGDARCCAIDSMGRECWGAEGGVLLQIFRTEGAEFQWHEVSVYA